jgi:hypothetical protein
VYAVKRTMSKLEKSAPAWLVVLLAAIAASSLTYAILVSTRVEKIGVWQGVIETPHFTLVELSTAIKGLNRIDVTIVVKNTDTIAHSANITVQLLDADGEVILEDYELTGDIPGESTWQHTYTFKDKNIVKTYDSILVVIKELS